MSWYLMLAIAWIVFFSLSFGWVMKVRSERLEKEAKAFRELKELLEREFMELGIK